MKELYEFKLGSMRKNQGIAGLIFLLENYGAIENSDYYIEKDVLKINKEYFDKISLGNAYVKAFVSKFGPNTPIHWLIKDLDRFDDLLRYEKTEIINSIKGMKTNRYKNALENIRDLGKEEEVIYKEIIDTIENISSKNNLDENIFKLKTLFSNKIVYEYLAFADIKLNLNEFISKIAFLNKSQYHEDAKIVYDSHFSEKIKDDKKSGLRTCVECKSKTKDIFNIGHFNIVNDPGRKRSQFWNTKEDANLCAECALLYSLRPLGYILIEDDLGFININNSIVDLIKINRTNKNELRTSIESIICENIIDLYEKNKNIADINIEIKSKDEKTQLYTTKDITLKQDAIIIIRDLREELNELKYYTYSRKILSESFHSIINNQSVLAIFDKIVEETINEEFGIRYLDTILKIEMNRKNINIEKAMIEAFNHGKNVRKNILNEIRKNSRKKFEIKPFIFDLARVISNDEFDTVKNIIIKTYSYLNLEIPMNLILNINNNKINQMISRAFLVGLINSRTDWEGGNYEK